MSDYLHKNIYELKKKNIIGNIYKKTKSIFMLHKLELVMPKTIFTTSPISLTVKIFSLRQYIKSI